VSCQRRGAEVRSPIMGGKAAAATPRNCPRRNVPRHSCELYAGVFVLMLIEREGRMEHQECYLPGGRECHRACSVPSIGVPSCYSSSPVLQRRHMAAGALSACRRQASDYAWWRGGSRRRCVAKKRYSGAYWQVRRGGGVTAHAGEAEEWCSSSRGEVVRAPLHQRARKAV